MARSDEKLSQAFGEILRDSRNAAGISQQDLALKCGLDRTYISLLERGLRQPTIATLFKLSSELSVKPSLLVKMTEEKMED